MSNSAGVGREGAMLVGNSAVVGREGAMLMSNSAGIGREGAILVSNFTGVDRVRREESNLHDHGHGPLAPTFLQPKCQSICLLWPLFFGGGGR